MSILLPSTQGHRRGRPAVHSTLHAPRHPDWYALGIIALAFAIWVTWVWWQTG